jgi:glyoxylase-like metal-dependent hydrolase (beta-lactamase superfamily II)
MHIMRMGLLLLGLLAARADANVRLFVFDCGSLTFDDVSAFGIDNEETSVRTLFVPCYLIEHDDGETTRRLLFDAGLPAAVAGQGPVTPEPGMTMRYERSLVDQLSDLNLTPANVDVVAFSHLHFDHVGSAAAFQDAEHLIQATEYQAGFVDALEVYETSLFAPLSDSPRRLLEGDHDVFGDGSVRLISLPGHTPGHQALLVRLREPGPVVLSGDMYHFRLSRRDQRVPVFNTDADATRESMAKLEALLETEGAQLWIEHDQALADTLRLAPSFYQ